MLRHGLIYRETLFLIFTLMLTGCQSVKTSPAMDQPESGVVAATRKKHPNSIPDKSAVTLSLDEQLKGSIESSAEFQFPEIRDKALDNAEEGILMIKLPELDNE